MVIAIAHIAKSYDLHLILNRAILLKWQPEIIMNSMQIMCMKFEHMVFLDSLSFMPLSLRKLPEAFGLTSSKSWYPHYFSTIKNLDYVGPYPDVLFYGESDMSEAKIREFLNWYEGQKDEPFDNMRVLESYYQDDVTVLCQACQIFRRVFLAIGNIKVFLEAITIASACNKLLRKRFLKPDTMGIIPAGLYRQCKL
jgi:hypothetical protein